jgi:hypothetical protein
MKLKPKSLAEWTITNPRLTGLSLPTLLVALNLEFMRFDVKPLQQLNYNGSIDPTNIIVSVIFLSPVDLNGVYGAKLIIEKLTSKENAIFTYIPNPKNYEPDPISKDDHLLAIDNMKDLTIESDS